MARQLVAEALGTALLLISVVGSGIMAESLAGGNLAGGNVALALLANAIATGCMLFAIITTLGPVSGAHFNPAVTLAFLIRREIDARRAGLYVICQIVGGALGVWATHWMFDLAIFQSATHIRTGPPQWWSEAVATFGLLLVIFGGIAARANVAALVAFYITGAYWFTSSTSFANPAVTIARTLSDTFAGIAPADAPAFIAVQIAAAALATPALGWLFRAEAAPKA